MVRNTLQYLKIDAPLRASKIADWNKPLWWPLGLIVLLLALLVWPAWRALRRQDRETAFGEVVVRPGGRQ
jgi:hypothetical protein